MNSIDKRSVSLSEAAREIGASTSYEVLRRAVNRLGAGRKDERGRITISSTLVKAFKAERKRSGYLHPRGAKLADLIGRDEQIPDAAGQGHGSSIKPGFSASCAQAPGLAAAPASSQTEAAVRATRGGLIRLSTACPAANRAGEVLSNGTLTSSRDK